MVCGSRSQCPPQTPVIPPPLNFVLDPFLSRVDSGRKGINYIFIDIVLMVIFTTKFKIDLDTNSCFNNSKLIFSEINWSISSENDEVIICKLFSFKEDPANALMEWPTKVKIKFFKISNNQTEVCIRASNWSIRPGNYFLLKDYLQIFEENMIEYPKTGSIKKYSFNKNFKSQLQGKIR